MYDAESLKNQGYESKLKKCFSTLQIHLQFIIIIILYKTDISTFSSQFTNTIQRYAAFTWLNLRLIQN